MPGLLKTHVSQELCVTITKLRICWTRIATKNCRGRGRTLTVKRTEGAGVVRHFKATARRHAAGNSLPRERWHPAVRAATVGSKLKVRPGGSHPSNRTIRNWTGAPGSPKRTWADNGFFQCFCSMHQDASLSKRPFRPTWQRALKGLRPVVFNPCTLVRTWGTRPVPNGSPLQFESCQTSRPLWLAPLVKSDYRYVPPSPGQGTGQVTENPVSRDRANE